MGRIDVVQQRRNTYVMVSSMTNQYGNWDWNRIDDWIFVEIKRLISAIKLPSPTDIEDF